jgi:hypothetical protein
MQKYYSETKAVIWKRLCFLSPTRRRTTACTLSHTPAQDMVSEKRGIDMKGTIIAAMVAAAAAASAATIYALKKAHDKRLEAACNCDDLPEGGCTNEDECSCCDEPENEEDTENTAEAAGCCCADGVCSIDSEDDEADQPTTVHMPEEEPADDAKPEQDDSADDAEKTIPISSGDED